MPDRPATPATRPPQTPSPSGRAPMNWRSLRSWTPLIVILVLNVLIVNVFLAPSSPKSITIAYNRFVADVGSNDVTSITTSSGTIEGTFRHQTGATPNSKNKAKYFTTQVPSFAG